jgi:hypothetical protein
MKVKSGDWLILSFILMAIMLVIYGPFACVIGVVLWYCGAAIIHSHTKEIGIDLDSK